MCQVLVRRQVHETDLAAVLQELTVYGDIQNSKSVIMI